MKRSIAYREVGGSARAPASKSSMQRAVACALLAEGESILRSPSRSADCMAALGVAAALGAAVEDRGSSFAIRGLPSSAFRAPAAPGAAEPLVLGCGESGLCIRMFSPIAALFGRPMELRAEGTLKKRSVGMIVPPLVELGASCEASELGLPPVRLRGPLLGGRAKVDGSSSSQLLTGLLVALPMAPRDSELEVEGLASRGYVDLTIATMRAFGVEAERDDDYRIFRMRGSQRYEPTDFAVEGDWSGAAFLLAAAAIGAKGEGLSVTGLDPLSCQPDRAILEALKLCGAGLEVSEAEIHVRRQSLKAFSFDATDCPDLFPPLVALASACDGRTRLRGANRLRGKESDRAAALSEEFGALGAVVEVDGDLMTVEGCSLGSGGLLQGGKADSRGDHRMAMAAAIAALASRSCVEIEGAECVAKSWPSFFEDFAAIAR